MGGDVPDSGRLPRGRDFDVSADRLRQGAGIEDERPHAEALERTGFWGARAAGCLVMSRSTGRLLVARRSPMVLEPGTWGTWGGAVPEGETEEASVLRELAEETGCGEVEALAPLWTFRDGISGFTYANFLAIVGDEFDPVLNWENDLGLWVREGQWPNPLHFGLALLIDNALPLAEVVAGFPGREGGVAWR